MSQRRALFLWLLLGGIWQACLEEPTLQVQVVPLNAVRDDPIDRAEYDIKIWRSNGTPYDELYLEQPGVGTDSGTGGRLEAEFPCEFGYNPYLFEITLNGLTTGSGNLVEGAPFEGGGDFVNPAPDGDPLRVPFDCPMGGRLALEIELMIMRRADKGFFDHAVNLHEIFCSAKADSCIPGENERDPWVGASPILVHFGGERREHAMVVALACSGGAGEGVDTELFLKEPELHCSYKGEPISIPLTLDHAQGVRASELVAQKFKGIYALYYGEEELECEGSAPFEYAYNSRSPTPSFVNGPFRAVPISGGWLMLDSTGAALFTFGASHAAPPSPVAYQDTEGGISFKGEFELQGRVAGWSCNKRYFNIAINLEALEEQELSQCVLDYQATAQNRLDPAFTQGPPAGINWQYPGPLRYPMIDFGVSLTDMTATPACDAHPLFGVSLDGGNTKVRGRFLDEDYLFPNPPNLYFYYPPESVEPVQIGGP